MIYLLLALNFGISWFNCWSVGGIWAESKALGGFPRVLAWCGAIQAAIGFSSVLGALIGFVLYHFGLMPPRAVRGAASLWYLLVIIPAIGTGLIITIQSWIVAWRERSLANMGTAAWNTFAQAHNMYGAIDGIGSSLSTVIEVFFADDDEDGAGGFIAGVALLVVVLALAGGIILTAALIQRYAGRLQVPARAAA